MEIIKSGTQKDEVRGGHTGKTEGWRHRQRPEKVQGKCSL
jgi:hypothetical protein